MRGFRLPALMLGLGMMLLGFSLGSSVSTALGAGVRPYQKSAARGVSAMLVPRPIYLPVIAKSGNAPVWPPAPGSSWLAFVNYYRALALLPPVTEDPVLTDGDQKHAHYMILNNVVVPYESSLGPLGYTPEGAAAAVNSLLLGSTSSTTTDEQALASWMQGPFHALAILDPALQRTGFGSDRNPGGALVQMAAALNVISGLDQNSVPAGIYPVMWPSDGMTVYLRTYTQGTDAPEPLTSCPGYLSPTGLPILLLVGDGSVTMMNVTGAALKQGTTSLEYCLLTENTYVNPDSNLQTRGRALLGTRDAIVIIPRYPLNAGVTYTVSLTVNGQFYRWSFTAGN